MFRNLFARGSDGAPARVWVIRSAAFTTALLAWELWGGLLLPPIPSYSGADVLAKSSSELLVALYLAYAGRSPARAGAAVAVMIASAVGTEIFRRSSAAWIIQAASTSDDFQHSAEYVLIQAAGAALTIVAYWAAWGIARRHTSVWVWTLPIPLALCFVVTPVMQAMLERAVDSGAIETSTSWQTPIVVVYSAAVIIPILAAWAVDAVIWLRAGAPDWTEHIAQTPRPPDPLPDTAPSDT